MLKEFCEELNKKSSNYAFFYITLDPERVTGLDSSLTNLYPVCLYNHPLVEDLKRCGRTVMIMEDAVSQKELSDLEIKGSYGIISHPAVTKFITIHGNGRVVKVVTLKNTQAFETVVAENRWTLAGPSSAVASLFEEKISQFEQLKNKVVFPKTEIAEMQAVDESSLQLPCIIQFNLGHSGSSTIKVDSLEVLRSLKIKFPERKARIGKFLSGETYTLNGLVLKDGRVMHGSISLQITGLPEATSNPNATVGNDFGAARRKLTSKQSAEILRLLNETGYSLHAAGYKGMFGIDVLAEESSGAIFFIEVNTHQPASISFEAELHKKEGVVPIFLVFFADECDMKIEDSVINAPPLLLNSEAKQVIFRNKETHQIEGLAAGRPSAIEGAKIIGVRSRRVPPNGEIYRIQWFG